MDEKELNPQEEFSLEDILKEFGSFEDQNAPQQEKEDDVRLWDGNMPEEPVQQQSAGDTVRLGDITQAVKKLEQETVDATIRFAPVETEQCHEETVDATVRFTPVGGEDDQEEPVFIPQQEEKVEPYSEQWEPEYEQPIGEYIPPEPIVFRPKNRLQELKRKLVNGPEKRYYELLEKGVGKLQVAIFLNLFVAVLAVGATAMHAFGMVGEDRIRLLVYGQFLFLLLSAMLGSYQLIDGFSDLIRKRFSLNTLLLFSFVACCADGIICLKFLRIPCCGIFSVNMAMSLWSAYQKRNTEIAQMDTMRKATRLDGLACVEDAYDGRPAFVRTEGQVEDFMDFYDQTSGVEKTISVYALVALFISFAIGVLAWVLRGPATGIQSFAAALLASVPATAYIMLSRPMALLERRLHKLGTVICGWQGVKNLSQNGVFPINDMDLVPVGAAKLNGVKFYGNREPDEVVAYATALIAADGGGMAPLFMQLLESRSGYHYEAGNIQSYSGGIGGEVEGEAVLAGTMSFLRSMGVEVPEGTRVNQAVYVAIDGTFSGVFAVTYNKVKSAAMGLTTLCAYRGLTPILTAGDFMVTEGFLRSKFGVNTRRIAFPDRQTRLQLTEIAPEEGKPASAMTTKDGLASLAYAVTGARALRSASTIGVVIHMLGGILGLLIVLALIVVNATHLLTPANLLLYELIWLIPGILITEWTRIV